MKHAKMLYERDMKSEYLAMNERLNSACGSKVALLMHDLSDLKEDLERINGIIATIEMYNKDMVGFMRKSLEVRDLLELAVSKPIRT